ncbi:MAG: chemotaxis protein CheX [Magnetococcales bacterium]|nr:chemotaxis protein CheX [Magnetococcales bacterium]
MEKSVLADQFSAALKEAVQELAETMLSREIIPGDGQFSPLEQPVDFSAVVSYSGAIQGSLCLSGPAKSVLALASTLIGEERPYMDPDLEDSFSEICNIIGGGVQTRMEPTLGSISMSPPVVVSGHNHAVVARDEQHACVSQLFSMDGQTFFTEIFYKCDEPASS